MDAPTPPEPRGPRPLELVGSAVSSFALVALVLVALAMIVVPLAIGATPFTVLTGSMEPSMPPGALVVTRPADPDTIDVGDVVTYQLRSNEPEVVTHRVVGVGFGSAGERVFVTRGDANDVDDEPVRAVQIRGVVAYHVPYLGYLNTWVGMNRPGWLLKAVAAALIGYGLLLVGSGVRDRLRRRRPEEAVADDVTAAEPGVTSDPVEPDVPASRVAPGAVLAAVLVTGLVVGIFVLSRRSP
ncbi:signal peptidase I [uncultured Cellulomonas sp.]|uniref:signal peptidase I n=1 Tax=uncultured Cellulomonas sp. TaxID=189682 RepID=UPI0028ED38A8|nr:signal peptidase I [uncultured Cellulomonas sp.]